MTQIHEDFLFFRYAIDPSMDYMANLNRTLSMVAKCKGASLTARSISLQTDPNEIMVCVGYNETDIFAIDFAVFRIGEDGETPGRLEHNMAEKSETAAETCGDVICHDLFRVPGDPASLYVVFMVRKAPAAG